MLHIILDANFIVVPFQFRVDIFREIERLVPQKRELLTLSSVLKELDKIGQTIISTKYEGWKYEKEWRLMGKAEFPLKTHETMKFPSNALEGIVLGLRATKEDEARVIKLVQKRVAKVNIFRASRIFESFELQYENNPILI